MRTAKAMINLPSGHTTLKQRQFNVDSTSWRWINVESILFQCCVPAGLSSLISAFTVRFNTESLDNVNFIVEQTRPWSDCSNVQADPSVYCSHIIWYNVHFLMLRLKL